MIKFYGYKKCGTCRKAEGLLEKMGQKYQFIDITTDPPSANELKSIITQSRLDLKKFFNVSGELYREMNLKDKVGTMTLDQAVDLLSRNGKLIKRPLVVEGKKATIGLSEDAFKSAWMP